MTKVVPSISVMTVVFPDGPPLSFTQVRSPLFPWNSFFASFIQPMLLAGFHIRNGRLLTGTHWISSLFDGIWVVSEASGARGTWHVLRRSEASEVRLRLTNLVGPNTQQDAQGGYTSGCCDDCCQS